MSDVGKPRPPGDELSRPDVGFHDDKVGSELKHSEAAKRRAMQARTAVKPRRLEQEPRKVAAAGAFRKAAREEEPHVVEAKRHQRALVSGQPQPRGRGKVLESKGDAERAAARVQTLFSAMVTLEGAAKQEQGQASKSTETKSNPSPGERKVEAIDADGRQSQGQDAESLDVEPTEEASSAERSLAFTAAERLARAHQQARFHVQHLVAGGTGFALGPDPTATFAELFSRLPSWPQGVPPGRTPQCESDFDLFFAWVFSPGEPTDLETLG